LRSEGRVNIVRVMLTEDESEEEKLGEKAVGGHHTYGRTSTAHTHTRHT